MKLWHHYTGSLSKAAARRRARNVLAVDRAVGSVLEPLETRRLYSVSAVSAGGVLTVTGDNADNVITVSRDAGGTLLVNGGAVNIVGPAPTASNTTLIEILGLGGNDRLSLDETNGVLPSARIDGGDGNDVLTGGSGADTLDGGAGYDQSFGKGGNDVLHGDGGNDVLVGGPGTDQAFGDAGNDYMIWNPGDGSDVNEGGDGNDTVVVNGGDVSEVFTASAVGSRVLFQRTSPGPFSIDIGTSENLVLNANGGDDSFDGSAVPAGLMSFTINGGDGNDTLLGTGGADALNGGYGDDFVDGNGGVDVAHLGAGNDVFRWDPGDGSDVVEGQAGYDLMLFNGSGGAENIDLSANGERLKFFRDAGNITMDVDGTEAVQFNAVGGADTITVHDLRATDVQEVDLNLARTPVAGQVDSVIVEGSDHRDFFDVDGTASGVSVASLVDTVNIRGAQTTDKLAVNALGGNDIVEAIGLEANVISFSADGGRGNDLVIGSAGNDTLLGNDGNDLLIGGPGQDLLDGGAGHDVVIQ